MPKIPRELTVLEIRKLGLGKLFKTPIFERWGKQFCLN